VYVGLYSIFSLKQLAVPRDLHSFPTRRSSDLSQRSIPSTRLHSTRCPMRSRGASDGCMSTSRVNHLRSSASSSKRPIRPGRHLRSEEHTSELQSRENLVCRLLLEKKKHKYKTH